MEKQDRVLRPRHGQVGDGPRDAVRDPPPLPPNQRPGDGHVSVCMEPQHSALQGRGPSALRSLADKPRIEGQVISPKLSSGSTMPITRLIPMLIVLPTLAADLIALENQLIVLPTLAADLIALENQFSRGYEKGARVFYVSI